MSMAINTSFSRGPGGCLPSHEKGATKSKGLLTGAQAGTPGKQAQPALLDEQSARPRPTRNGVVQAPAPAPTPAPVGPGTLLDLRA